MHELKNLLALTSNWTTHTCTFMQFKINNTCVFYSCFHKFGESLDGPQKKKLNTVYVHISVSMANIPRVPELVSWSIGIHEIKYFIDKHHN